MKKKILSGILAAAMLTGMGAQASQTVYAYNPEPIVLEKSTLGNPIAGFNESGDLVYAGDPAILVDGDTVYLYVGHDAQSGSGSYNMPDYLCYSTTDLIEWRYEGVTMDMKDVSWATNDSAWASQVIKYKEKYYLLFCAEKPGAGKATGIAISDSPTGPFTDIGEPLILPSMTDTATYKYSDGETAQQKYNEGKLSNGSFGHEDIDPTAWIDTDADGKEHIYMAWGNTNPWMCELIINGDDVKVKDQNGDGKITQGPNADLWFQHIAGMEKLPANGWNEKDMVDFTEAPYLYRRQNENGEYYGKYYLFFATHWREEMGYATTDDITSNEWTYGGRLMEPTATSDTNHPAVFDFKGHTYFIYHNGSLPAGMGQRRVICIEEMEFNGDGSINYVQETSTGLTGVASIITNKKGNLLSHEAYENSLNSDFYPILGDKAKKVSLKAAGDTAEADAKWEIIPGRADEKNKNYVTIESYNKPGLYLMADSAKNVVLAHDHNDDKTAGSDGKTKETNSITFRTLKGFAGDGGVTFESVAYPGYYLTSDADGNLTVSQNPDAEACTFFVSEKAAYSIAAEKTKRAYDQGDQLNVDDIRVKVIYSDGSNQMLREGFTVETDAVDMSTPGKKTLTVTYTADGRQMSDDVDITVWAYPEIEDLDTN